MDALIFTAARALAAGDPLAALKRVALRDDPPALAVRGIAMAQLGDLARARDLLRRAAREFGPAEPVARARCALAEAEIALVCRDLGRSLQTLTTARVVLEANGDRRNAAHAAYLKGRYLLLTGRVDDAEKVLDALDLDALPRSSRVGHELVLAGIAIRRDRAGIARAALERAGRAAESTKIPALVAEVDQAVRRFEAPVTQLVSRGGVRLVRLDEIEILLASDTLVVDAFRKTVRLGATVIPLGTRPVLVAIIRSLAEAWPDDVRRETLLRHAFGAQQADESHRARLRVEIARLREAIQPLAAISATRQGFVLQPIVAEDVAVLAPPTERDHADLLALIADGEAWSSSALALALGVSARTVQRALEDLAREGKVEAFGRGRAIRWIAASVPGFPTSLLLPTAAISG
jgi:tetratricopeptide (TPR) repeat protein